MHTPRLLFLAAAVTVVAPAFAASQRTFVASIGTDNPACSITAPCRSFAAAITATIQGGEVIVLDSAGYGTVTISKSISIIAPSGVYAGISVAAGNGITIDAPGATVVLRGLSINGQGGSNGILLNAADRVRVENCVISNMGAQGIYHQADNADVIVLDTVSRDNGDGGIALVAQNASIVLDHVRSEHNVNVGFYIAPVVPALFAKATITDSLFANNGGNGIWADSVGSAVTTVMVERTTVTGNPGGGIQATSGAAGSVVFLTVNRSTFIGNQPFGVHALGILPGGVVLDTSENSVGADGIIADGDGSYMGASGNTGALVCKNGAHLTSYGDNRLGGLTQGACSLFHASGF
jgi:hypothetical protein